MSQHVKTEVQYYESYNNILIKLKKLTKNHDTELYFVYLPFIETFYSNGNDENDKRHSRVISMVKDLDIEYIDLLSQLKSEQSDPLSMFGLNSQHLNEKGYRFVAESIINKFK